MCADCGDVINADLKYCPRCKGKQRDRFGVLPKLLIGLLVLALIGGALMIFGPR